MAQTKLMDNNKSHSFHIPVMGLGFTIDTPLKVAHFGISSVIALGDDLLMEKMRKYYLEKNSKNYEAIDKKDPDGRAKRTTQYLNTLHEMVQENFNKLKALPYTAGNDLMKYFELLPNTSFLKCAFNKMKEEKDPVVKEKMQASLKEKLTAGTIDANIMTKVDNFEDSAQLETVDNEQRRAHASLRGFAKSKVNGSVILSAGLNPLLFAYFEQLPEFLPNSNMEFKKKVVLKVSDFRSALIQGKMLAKKGVWVSEYRIESGLNCGGHAFATNGILLGPILQEFKEKRQEIFKETADIYTSYLKEKNINVNQDLLKQGITVQGGIGNADEHEFLLDYYQLESTGWGSPFLLVPEAVNVDKPTLDLLAKADENDIYLSKVSPLGVYFNNLRNSSFEIEKTRKINKNRPGSSCPKKFLAMNTEFTEQPICVASRQYQDLKIKDLKSKNLPEKELQKEIDSTTEKTCLCVGLGTSALLVNDINTRVEGNSVEVCPGPNLAYFSKIASLKEMVGHIYGKNNLLSKKLRPHVFLKELNIYIDYLKKELIGIKEDFNKKELRTIESFKSNLLEGIEYYQNLFSKSISNSPIAQKYYSFELKHFKEKVMAINVASNS